MFSDMVISEQQRGQDGDNFRKDAMKSTTKRVLPTVFAVLLAVAAIGCAKPRRPTPQPLDDRSLRPQYGTDEDRAALFDFLLEATLQREALSPIKQQHLQIDVETEMRKFRDDLISADSSESLLYALIKISNARRDRHLSVQPVDGGIWPARWGAGQLPRTLQAPLRFAVDYGQSPPDLFVGDYARNLSDFSESADVQCGDRLVKVNGRPLRAFAQEIEPYIRYSTRAAFWWELAEMASMRHFSIPPRFYRLKITYVLERKDGSRYNLKLPYLDPDSIKWTQPDRPRYKGFRLLQERDSFDFYRHRSQAVILLDWHGFGSRLLEDIDWLAAHALQEGLLSHGVILDATRSGGGTRGAYALQRLSPKPFKTTFGNLRLSGITPQFVAERLQLHRSQQELEVEAHPSLDDGSRLAEWLENDVMREYREGRDYSGNVPFKLIHASKDSDGVLQPAETHFQGPLVCLFSPHGGSHLDQFAAIIADNKLGYSIGMATAGYSNTWEWQEILVFPSSRQEVVRYMWSIGQTIRPNGEVLEGNPAQVDEFVAQTRENYLVYRDLLVQRALKHMRPQ